MQTLHLLCKTGKSLWTSHGDVIRCCAVYSGQRFAVGMALCRCGVYLPANQRVDGHLLHSCKMSAPIIQYVVVRGDLYRSLKWPIGAIIAQACHACSAVMHLYHDDPNTQQYTSDLDRMHKVVLEVSSDEVCCAQICPQVINWL